MLVEISEVFPPSLMNYIGEQAIVNTDVPRNATYGLVGHSRCRYRSSVFNV